MTQKVCIHCGTPIQPLAKHCFNCLAPTADLRNEDQLQYDCVAYFDMRWGANSDAMIVHHENNQTNAVAGAKSRRSGVRKNMPDLQVIHSNGRSIFIELKFGKNKPTKGQREMHTKLNKLGHVTHTAWTLREFVEIVSGVL